MKKKFIGVIGIVIAVIVGGIYYLTREEKIELSLKNKKEILVEYGNTVQYSFDDLIQTKDIDRDKLKEIKKETKNKKVLGGINNEKSFSYFNLRFNDGRYDFLQYAPPPPCVSPSPVLTPENVPPQRKWQAPGAFLMHRESALYSRSRIRSRRSDRAPSRTDPRHSVHRTAPTPQRLHCRWAGFPPRQSRAPSCPPRTRPPPSLLSVCSASRRSPTRLKTSRKIKTQGTGPFYNSAA